MELSHIPTTISISSTLTLATPVHTRRSESLPSTTMNISTRDVEPPTARPTWTTIDDDELDLLPTTDSQTDGRSDQPTAHPVGDGEGSGELVGETSRMSDEMEDAVGGLMQMAGSGVGLSRIVNETETAGRLDHLPGTSGHDMQGRDGEDELRDDEEESVVPPGPVGRGRGKRGSTVGGRGKRKTDGISGATTTTTTAKKGSRKSTAMSKSVPFNPHVTTATPSVITTTQGIPVDYGASTSTPVEMMEVDEIGDDDDGLSLFDTLDIPEPAGGKKRRGGKAGGSTGTKGRKKPVDVEMDDTETVGSAPGTPGKSNRKKRTVGPPSNNGDGWVQGPGGVTKNQPQYHVMKLDDGDMCGRADIQVSEW
jgi:hypothetical protein